MKMDGVLVLFFFEIRVANSSINSGHLLIVLLAHFSGLLTKLPAFTGVTLCKEHGCLIGHVNHVGGLQARGSVMELQGCVKTFLLISSWFCLSVPAASLEKSSSLGSGLVCFWGGGGGADVATSSSSGILPTWTLRRTLRVG